MLKIIKSVVYEMYCTFCYILSISVYPISKLLVIMTPYLFSYIVLNKYKMTNTFSIGIEYLIPLLILLLSYLLKSIANKIGKGENPPIPNNRFTSEDSEGEVSCEYSRLQELLLFVNDYENWLTRKGLL